MTQVNPSEFINGRDLIEEQSYPEEVAEDSKGLRDSNNTVSYSEAAPLHLRDSTETVVTSSQALVTDVTTNLFGHSDDCDEKEDDGDENDNEYEDEGEDEDEDSISQYEYDDGGEEISDIGNGSASNRSQLELNNSFQYPPNPLQQRQQQSNRTALNSRIQHLLQKYPSPFRSAATADGQAQFSGYYRDGSYHSDYDITPIITVSDDEAADVEVDDRHGHLNIRGTGYEVNRHDPHLIAPQRRNYKAIGFLGRSNSLDSSNVATTDYNSINYTNLSH
jgi:hypothetical protein